MHLYVFPPVKEVCAPVHIISGSTTEKQCLKLPQLVWCQMKEEQNIFPMLQIHAYQFGLEKKSDY